jgi:hypothetical protein
VTAASSAATKTRNRLAIQDVEEHLEAIRPGEITAGHWSRVAHNADAWAKEVTAGPFWTEAGRRLAHWRGEYRQTHGSDLLGQIGLPNFVSKSESSIQDKVVRACKGDSRNAVELFSDGSPPVPMLSDLVRTRVSCRYIDGVEFLATKLVELAAELNYRCSRDRQGKLEGYFAQHVTVHHDVFYRVMGHGQPCSISVEIQVASELATRMWDASHGLYETDRSDSESPSAKEWQWQPTNPRFITNQLGHMIHLADGLLVHLREVSKSEQKK